MDDDLRAELLKIQEALGRIEARLGPQPLPLRARTVLMPGRGRVNIRWSPLMPHAQQIAHWLETGKTQQEVVDLLAEVGVKTTRRSVNRFVHARLMPDEEQGR